jgi:hypothetical protein
MIHKRFIPSSWFRDYPTAHLLQVHSRGVDRSQALFLQKHAASEMVMHIDVRPEPGYSFVHLITMGAGEHYGANNNADYFNEKCGSYEIPEHYQSGGKQIIQLDGGLEKFHSTFMKYGAVYREHNNSKKGGPELGSIHSEWYNPAMHRGELVVKLPNNKWASDLQKLANGDPVYWSMGCGVPYDICSICGNPAKTKNDYCDDLKYRKMSLSKEGHQAFAINDQPHLHDISKVRVPAYRAAFALRKVASEGVLPDDSEADGLWLPLSMIGKIGTELEQKNAEAFRKAAEIEKRILAKGLSPEESDLSQAFQDNGIDEETLKELQEYPLGDVLAALNKREIILPPDAFAQLVLKKGPDEISGIKGLPCAVKSVFSELADSGDNEVFSDSSYVPLSPRHWTGLEETADKMVDSSSAADGPVTKRIIKISIKGGPSLSKRASLLVSPTASAESRYLAKEYAKYQVSFMAGLGVNKYAHRVIVHNQVTG